jgi:hypothetical protein
MLAAMHRSPFPRAFAALPGGPPRAFLRARG